MAAPYAGDLPHTDSETSPNTSEASQSQAATQESDGVSLGEWQSHYERGVALLEAKEWKEALQQLTRGLKQFSTAEALSRAGGKQGEAKLLCARSSAFLELSNEVRQRPAAQSERHALYGLDPTQLAQLGLQDARRAAEAVPSEAAFLHQGQALHLLERYPEAEEALLKGLALDPAHPPLQRALASAQRMLAASPTGPSPQRKRRAVHADGMEDFECVLCMKLLYDPATTPCGHSFCRPCLLRALDHNNRCPVCRTVLHLGREVAVSISLNNIVARTFPEEYEQRRREVEAMGDEEGPAADSYPLPLFVMSMMVPGEKMALNIFEPRYRLLVRRCMEGGRRFGMAQVAGRDVPGGGVGGLEAVACEVEILECNPQPDGRYYLEVQGKQRVKLQQTWDLDGYRVARVTPLKDRPASPPPAASPPQPAAADADTAQPQQQQQQQQQQGSGVGGPAQRGDVAAVAREVEVLAMSLLDRIRGVMSRRGQGAGLSRMQALLDGMGEKPAPQQDAEGFSFWVAALLQRTMQLDVAPLMAMTSTRERLALEREVLQHAHASSGPCSIM